MMEGFLWVYGTILVEHAGEAFWCCFITSQQLREEGSIELRCRHLRECLCL